MKKPGDGLSVRATLRCNYSDYYSEGESEWRRLGAIAKAENIVRLCEHHPHGRILEIGSGDGAILKELSERGFGESLHAIDISQSGVDTVRRREIPGLRECRLFDGHNVPYGDDCFDLAILSHVLEHVEYPRRLIYEASRVSRLVFIEVPLEDNSHLEKNFVFDRVGHINFYSRRTFRRLVQTCDLEVVDQIVSNPGREGYRYRSGRIGTLKYLVKEAALRLAPRLATSVWTYHSALTCRRKEIERR